MGNPHQSMGATIPERLCRGGHKHKLSSNGGGPPESVLCMERHDGVAAFEYQGLREGAIFGSVDLFAVECEFNDVACGTLKGNDALVVERASGVIECNNRSIEEVSRLEEHVPDKEHDEHSYGEES